MAITVRLRYMQCLKCDNRRQRSPTPRRKLDDPTTSKNSPEVFSFKFCEQSLYSILNTENR
jgi:hypothetical protein